MKYIRFEYAGFVIFDNDQIHKDIADKFPDDNVLSAGNIALTCDETDINLYGESLTLKTEPKIEDIRGLYRKMSLYSA